MTFTAIVVSHANARGLRSILGCLRYQTRPPDETIAFVSGLNLMRLREEFNDVRFFEVPDFNDWGHTKRAQGIAIATGDYIGFFNDDDTYAADYIAKMLHAAEGHDVAYCEWNENPNCDFRIYKSTAGNFIVRTELARQVGWNDRAYEADGHFIEGLNAAGAEVVKVHERLYTHNA